MANQLGGAVMKLTEESKNLLLPILDKPMTEDEFLDTLSLEKIGVDYRSVMSYDPVRAQKFNARMLSAPQSN